MIDDTTWTQLKSFFLEVFSWASSTLLFNLTINNVSVKISIFEFAVATVAFDLVVGVVWAVLSGRSSDD